MGTGDERSFIGSKEQNRIGDFMRVADAVEQMLRTLFDLELIQRDSELLAVTFRSLSKNCARADAIDPDVKRGKVHRHISCHLHHGCFCRTISHKIRLSDKSRNRTEIDYRPLALAPIIVLHRFARKTTDE